MSDSDAVQMDPQASPDTTVVKKGRRLNDLPVILLGSVVLLFIVVIALVAADRADQQNAAPPSALEKGGNTSFFAKEIVAGHVEGIIDAASPPKPPVVPDQVTEIPAADSAEVIEVRVERPQDLNSPPRPPSAAPGPRDETADRIRMAKIQLLEEAIRAKTTVNVASPRSPGWRCELNGPIQGSSCRRSCRCASSDRGAKNPGPDGRLSGTACSTQGRWRCG